MKFGSFFAPMLLKERFKPFDNDDYIYEIKFDGIRATIHVNNDFIKIFSRRGVDITKLYPELKEIKSLIKKNVIFDGEIVLFNDGMPNFSKLLSRNRLKDEKKIFYFSQKHPVTFVAFDCLYENKKLVDLPLLKRKNVLEKYPDTDFFIKSLYIFKDGKKLYNRILDLDLEGIVAKKKDSLYEIGTRSDSWIKIKNFKRDVFYVGGYTYNTQKVSLLIGEYRKKKLYYVGKVSITRNNDFFKKILGKKSVKNSHFVNYDGKTEKFINPNFKIEVEYIERTENNNLRQPVFLREIL